MKTAPPPSLLHPCRRHTVSTIKIYKLDCYLHSRSSYHDKACKAAASCSRPRTASGHHDVVQYGQRRWPVLACLPFYTPHTAGGCAGTWHEPSANDCCTHVCWRCPYRLGAVLCAHHSKGRYHKAPVLDTLGACKVRLVCMAYHLSFQREVRRKDWKLHT